MSYDRSLTVNQQYYNIDNDILINISYKTHKIVIWNIRNIVMTTLSCIAFLPRSKKIIRSDNVVVKIHIDDIFSLFLQMIINFNED